MIEGRPSRTAIGVAMRRAAHQLIDAPPIFEDPLALRILGPDLEARVRHDPHERERTRVARTLRTFLAIRSRLAEEALADAVRAGARQYVVLGAGLDSFAYRNPHAGLRVFEMDFPATQAWKRGVLAKAGIAEPTNVTYAPCDFTKQSAADALRAAGLDESRITFCSWLGVTMYLEPEAVMATIRAMLPIVKAPGGIVFDYRAPASTLGFPRRLVYAAAMAFYARRFRKMGEPFIASFVPAELRDAIMSAGAHEVVNHSPADVTARYLDQRRDSLRVSGVGHIMLARG